MKHCLYSTRRVVGDYQKNITNSLSSHYEQSCHHVSLTPLRDSSVMLDAVHKHADLIREHAIRRGDLFFYQMVGLYKLNERYGQPVNIQRSAAALQYGAGSMTLMMHACHSSLYPEIDITTVDALGNMISIRNDWINTFLYHSLNATVQLPAVVNGFDGHLEGRRSSSEYVNACLTALNQVANGIIDPRDGMNSYYESMHRFFSASKSHYFHRTGKYTSLAIKQAIYDYQRLGTFLGATDEMKMLDEYLYLLLRLNESDIDCVKRDSTLLEGHYRRVHDEIWQAKWKGKSR